jgi:hypothetical protein
MARISGLASLFLTIAALLGCHGQASHAAADAGADVPAPHTPVMGAQVLPSTFNGVSIGLAPNYAGPVGQFATGSNVVQVTKGGADSATCGSIASPCLTISQAMANTTTATASSPWTIALGPGTYTENIVQKDSVNIVGQSFENTKIVGNLSLASGFISGNDAGMTGVDLVASTCTFESTAHGWNYIFFNDIVVCDITAQLGSSLNFYYVSWVPVSSGMSVTDMSETITSQASFFDNGGTITLTASTEAWDWESFSDAFSCPVKVIGTGAFAMSFVMADNMGVGGVTIDGANAFWSGNVLAWPASPITFQGGASWVTNVQPGLSSQLAGLIPGAIGQVATTIDAGGGGLMVGWSTPASAAAVSGTGLWYSASGGLNSAAVTPTGDITAVGALSGTSLPLTVGQIHGATVPAAGSLTTGNGLYVSGSSALGYGALNLAGGSAYVTGTLPVANLPSGSGDWTGAITSNAVTQLTGSAGVVNVISGTALTWLTTGHTSAAGGRINFPADVASNLIEYHYAGTDYVALNTDGGGNLFLGVGTIPGIIVDAATDAEITAGGSTLFVGGTGIYASSNFLVGATSFDIGGGSTGIVDIAPAGTAPTALPSTHVGVWETASGQKIGVNANGLLFGAWISAPEIFVGAQTTDTAPPTLTISGGNAWSGASTNKSGGSLALTGGEGITGGIAGPVEVVSSLTLQTVNKSANYTIDSLSTAGDVYVMMDSSGGARMVTLPAPTTGRHVAVGDKTCSAATHNITVAQHASESIGGVAASYVISVPCAVVVFPCDGTNWEVQ